MIKKYKIIFPLLALLLCLSVLAACGDSYKVNKEKETIVIGGSRSITGHNAYYEQYAYGPVYRMWAEEINADGGIYVKEYGKKMPIELVIYDDTGDISVMEKNLEKSITQDKADFILSPTGTDFIYDAASITGKYEKILIGAEGSSVTIEQFIEKYPYYFSTLGYAKTQAPALCEILLDREVSSVFIVYSTGLYGTEYSSVVIPMLTDAGIKVKGVKNVAADEQSMSEIIEAAAASGADAFLCLTYSEQGYAAINEAIAVNYKPDVWFMGEGGAFSDLPQIYGKDCVHGIMTWGAWNPDISDEAAELFERYKEYRAEVKHDVYDYRGFLNYYAGLQCLRQAIEETGTLNNKKIRNYLNKNHFDTVLGDTWFDGQMIAEECLPGNIGQWQKGEFEIIDLSEKATAVSIIKRAWPQS